MDNRIFKYFDGETEVYADPSELDLEIARLDIESMLFPTRLADMPVKEDGSIDFEKADPNDVRLMLDLYREAEPLIRQAFHIKPFDRATGKGMLYQEVVELFGTYTDWRNGIKKNSDVQQNSVTPTDSTPLSSGGMSPPRPSMGLSSMRSG